MRGPQGLPGNGNGYVYNGEAYDDCRSAFGSISPQGLRLTLDDPDISKLADSDLGYLLNIMCLLYAANPAAFPDLIDSALPPSLLQ